MEAFEDALAPSIFEAEMLPHLSHHSSGRFREASRAEILGFLSVALEEARKHGFRGFVSASQFVEIAVLFGADFSTTQPWARRIFEQSAGIPEADVAAGLLDSAVEFLDRRERLGEEPEPSV